MFRRMRPGVPIAMLHGRMKQKARMGTFRSFCDAKHAALFATDVAARGLDFPAVDWVVQADCPEDVPCYIHRVGRTARYTSEGKGLLLLTPSEAAFAKELAAAKVPLKTMKLNQAKNRPITSSIQGLLGKDSDLKYLAQRAVVSYLRSVYLQPNKAVFDVDALDVEAYSHSMGLPNPPRLRFLKGGGGAGAGAGGSSKGGGGGEDDDDSDEDDDGDGDGEKREGGTAEEQEQDSDDDSDDEEAREERGTSAGVLKRVGGGHFGLTVDDADEDDELMTVKRANHRLSNAAATGGGDGDDGDDDEGAGLSAAARAALADGPADLGAALRARAKKGKLRIKDSGHGGNAKVVFGDDGEAMRPLEALGDRELGPAPTGGAELAAAAKRHYDRVKLERMRADEADREREKERLRGMRDKAKMKARETGGEYDSDGGGDGATAVLGGSSDDDDDDDDASSESDSDRGGGGGGGRKRGGGGGASSSDDDSDSDSDAAAAKAKRARRTDVAVAVMAPADEKIESLEARALKLLG
jgi:ATP-dependent RNA helicase DDX10/DBP4